MTNGTNEEGNLVLKLLQSMRTEMREGFEGVNGRLDNHEGSLKELSFRVGAIERHLHDLDGVFQRWHEMLNDHEARLEGLIAK